MVSENFTGAGSIIRQAGNKDIGKGEIYRVLFDISRDLIFVLDKDMRIISANESLCRAAGRSASELEGLSARDVPELSICGGSWPEAFRSLLKDKRDMELETAVRLKDGTFHHYKVSLTPILEKDGSLSGVLGNSHDITGIRQSEEEIRRLAFHDALTGLPNRLMLEQRLEEIISLSTRNGQKFGILYLDLDNFKKVNDTLSHSIGDELLMEIGARLQTVVRKYDLISRIGGDEFAIVMLDIKKPKNLAITAERMLRLFEVPFVIRRNTIYISASIGISVFPDDCNCAGDLLQNMDTAMYKAKSNGRNNYQFYDSVMKEEMARKVNIEKHLRRAVQDNELSLDFQPLIDVKTGSIRGYEALLRWNCRELGSVPPADFIPVAEESSLIVHVEEWALKTACRKKKEWEQDYSSKALISVNISAAHFRQEDFVGRVSAILGEAGLSPEYLELEITESVLIHYPDDVIHKLQELKKLGVKISLDDFGTGYSSLNYLRLLPIDTLKIDKSFIEGISSKTRDKFFVKSIVGLMRKYKLDIVAEGVETAEQFEYLSRCKCNFVQGYLLGKPVADGCFQGMLNSGRVDLRYLVSQ